jgi:hypothetical protein
MIAPIDAYTDLVPVIPEKPQRRLSDFICDILCSRYKQSVSMIICGAKGMGKSYAGLSIADACSKNLTGRLGGKPSDYFNPDIDMAIISEDEVDRVSALQRRHGIKIYDDVSIGWSARDWRSTENAAKNDIFTIDRISEGLSIFTLPASFQLDKIPRSLAGFYCEMEGKYFSRGFSTMKFFKTIYLGRDNRLIYRHLLEGSSKYVLYTIPTPPTELCDWYDRNRERITNIEIEKRKRTGTTPQPSTSKVLPHVTKMQARIGKFAEQLKGKTEPEKIKILTTGGIPNPTAYYWLKAGHLSDARLGGI